MKIKNKLLSLIFFLQILNLKIVAQNYQYFRVSYDVEGHKDKSMTLVIQKGVLTGSAEINQKSKRASQSLLVCGILSSNYNPNKINENAWKINIPAGKTLNIALLCYCFDKGFALPTIDGKYHVSKYILTGEAAEQYCTGQAVVHGIDSTMKAKAEFNESYNLPENFNNLSDKLKYKELIIGMLSNWASKKIGVSKIYYVKINGRDIEDEINTTYDNSVGLKFKEGDILSFSDVNIYSNETPPVSIVVTNSLIDVKNNKIKLIGLLTLNDQTKKIIWDKH